MSPHSPENSAPDAKNRITKHKPYHLLIKHLCPCWHFLSIFYWKLVILVTRTEIWHLNLIQFVFCNAVFCIWCRIFWRMWRHELHFCIWPKSAIFSGNLKVTPVFLCNGWCHKSTKTHVFCGVIIFPSALFLPNESGNRGVGEVLFAESDTFWPKNCSFWKKFESFWAVLGQDSNFFLFLCLSIGFFVALV